MKEKLKDLLPKLEELIALTKEILEDKPPTLNDVKAVLIKKCQEGFRDEVKSIIESHGADNVSSLPEEAYAAVIAEAEVLK